MGLSRWTRALVALGVLLPAFAASTATAATLNEPVLGSRAIEPVIDRNAPGLIEAFDFVAKSDGPVDVVNVYLDRYAGTPNLSRPNARLHAGIYANGSNNRPGARLGNGLIANFNHHGWNTVPITPVELEKGKHYWIAVMGTVEEISLHTNASRPATGTSASATSPRNQSQLPANYNTAAVYPNDGPASIYAAERYSVLVFTKNATVGASEGVAALRSLTDANEVTFDVTDDASKFTESNLAKYRAVVFLNTSGDVLDEEQQDAFEGYFRGGGGFFGIGSAIETEPDWQFFTDVLGARSNGKTAVQPGTIKVADRGHDASKNLPEYWNRSDAFYSFSSNVRGFSHVLATVVEEPFGPQPWGGSVNAITGGTMGSDHPVTWCKDYRGGRSFYTSLGNTADSFGEEDFRDSLAGAVRWAAGQSDPVYSDCGATVWANYQQTKISAPPNLSEPIGFDTLPDGRVIQTDRRGGVRLHDPVSNTTTVIAQVPVYIVNEDGMYGPAIDNNFAENKWVYLFYSPPTVKDVKLSDGSIVTQTTPTNAAPNTGASYSVWDPYVGYFQLSRFKFVDDPGNPHLDLASEQEILRVPNNRGACCHVAGDIDFDKHNNLWMVTGDDTPAGGGNSGGFGPFNDMKTNESQSITVANATGGTFTLTFDGQTTAPIPFPLDNAAIESALEGLSNVDDVAVTGGGARTVNFRGSLSETDVPQMTADGSGLTSATTATVTIATTTAGGLFNAPHVDARRGSLNTNDLRGKVLRIKVKDGDIAAGEANAIGGAYTVPAGNLFAPGTEKTRPEVYAMGFRNPFRIQVDSNDVAYVTDYSPDSNTPTNFRGPAGTGRVEIVRKPANYGWPVCYRTDLEYYRWNFNTSAPLDDPPQRFECSDPAQGPANESRWNVGGGPSVEPGLVNTPPITNPDVWYSFTPENGGNPPIGTPCLAYYDGSGGTCPRLFPELGTGGVGPHGAAKYEYDPDNPDTTKLPPYFDDAVFFGEFTRDMLREIRLDSQNRVFKINNLLSCGALGSGNAAQFGFECDTPMDMQFDGKGHFYLLTYGDNFFQINPDAGMYRWDYVKGQRAPRAVLETNRTDGPVPLTVQFSAANSTDPDPGDALSFEWDFDGNGTIDSTDPSASYTYTTAGVYTARLTVRDSSGKSAGASTTITAGNTSPTVNVTVPVEGGLFAFGENIPFSVTVSDPEDGPIDCSRVEVTAVLAHDDHGHAGAQTFGCSGVLPTVADDVSHGGNVWVGIVARYTDNGGVSGTPPLTTTDRHNIRQKLQQVEFVLNQAGTNTATTSDVGGGLHRGSLSNGDWIELNGPINLLNINSLTFRVADTAGGRTVGSPLAAVEVRTGAIDGPIVLTANLTSTGGTAAWESQTFPLTDPGGSNRLFLRFVSVAGGQGGNNMFNLNWVQFNGAGVGTP
jgi:type 1 glutamine amidotransferase